MSFTVRFNAEDEEVESLCTTPHHTGSIENYTKTPDQPLNNTHCLGLFGLKRSSSSDAEQSPCDTTIKRLDSYLSDIQENLWKNEIYNLSKSTKFDEIQKDTNQLNSDVLDTNWFTIRRRGTRKISTQIEQFEDVETAKDALEDINITSTKARQSFFEIESEAFISRNKIQFFLFLLIGIIICYSSYKLVPLYLNTFVLGGFIAFKLRCLIEYLILEDQHNKQNVLNVKNSTENEATILKTVQALFHMNPNLMLYKGWMNQFLYEYRPETYRLSLTISVYIRLKGSILIMSYPYYKVPKRSLYNETKPKLLFVKECMYDLTRCNIVLLPQNLVNKRKWSKKYPICVELHADSLIGVRRCKKSSRFIKDTDEWYYKDYVTPSKQAENFYKEMIEGEVIDIMDDSEVKDGIFCSENDKKGHKIELGSTKDQKMCELEQINKKITEKSINQDDSDVDGVWKTDSDKIYLFARNDPEKELWYHRLSIAATFNASIEIFHKKKTEERFKLQKAYLAYIHNVHELSSAPISFEKEKISRYHTNNMSQEQLFLWLNMLLGRICFDYLQNPKVLELVTDKFQRKLNAIRLPKVMDMIVIRSLCFGKGEIPTIRCASTPWVDHRGLWFELGIVYNGTFQASVDTKLNLMKLKKEETSQPKEEMRSAFYDSNQEDSGETSNDEGQAREDVNFAQRLFEQQALNEPPPLQGSRITRFVENMSSSLFEIKCVKRVLENVAKKELTLVIDVKQLIGTLIVNIPPPPSDRIWISFKGCPQINFEAKPKVNDTNVPLIDFLTKWLHNVLIKEFEKIIVLPNMTDFTIPMMNGEC